jgi:hypothetical protein
MNQGVCVQDTLSASFYIKKLRIKEDGKMKTRRENQQNQNRHASQLCHHVLSQQIYALKHCMLNYECYHCAYDQWLCEIDFEAARKTMGTETCQASIAVVA